MKRLFGKDFSSKNKSLQFLLESQVVCTSGTYNTAKMKTWLIIFSLIILIKYSSPQNTNNISNNSTSKYEWRLPETLKPHRYHVKIIPVLEPGHETTLGEQWTARGEVIIKFSVLSSMTQEIVLHANQSLFITDVKIENEQMRVIPTSNWVAGNYDLLTIHLDEGLKRRVNYSLTMSYTFPIGTEAAGLYRTSYLDPEANITRWVGVTHFEATYARAMFPCWDEPQLKAVFKLDVGRLENYTILSNTRLLKTVPMENVTGWVWDEFKETVPMSTYNLAFVVSSHYHSSPESDNDNNSSNSSKIKVYGPSHIIKEGGGEYARKMANLILPYLEKYFKQPYLAEKLDMAMSETAQFGGMENIGLNIYRTRSLAVFSNLSTESRRQNTLNLVAHEIVHQWFGNLVTPEFWTQYWLSEGLTTYFAYDTVANLAPELDSWDTFLTKVANPVMETDNLNPMVVDEKDWIKAYNALDWFNDIMYGKGSSLVRMMDGFLAKEVLMGGIRQYLQSRKFQTANQNDLFQDIENYGFHLAHQKRVGGNNSLPLLPMGWNLRRVMETWTNQPGYPTVTVRIIEDTIVIRRNSNNDDNIDNNTVTIGFTQEAFNKPNNDTETFWAIPISVGSDIDETDPIFWLMDRDEMLVNVTFDSWLILNYGAKGYYRVKYDPYLETLLQYQLNQDHTVIPSQNRAKLLSDYFAFAEHGTGEGSSLATAFSFTKYLSLGMKPERNWVVWSTLMSTFHMRVSIVMFQGAGLFSDMKNYFLPGLSRARKAALSSTSRYNFDLRFAMFMGWAFEFEDQDVMDYAVSAMANWKVASHDENDTLPFIPDLTHIVACAGVKADPQHNFEFVYQQYKQRQSERFSKNSEIASMLLEALGCVEEPSYIWRLLNGTILSDDFYIGKYDKFTVVSKLSGHPIGRRHLREFLKHHISDNSSKVTDLSHSIGSAFTYQVNTLDELSEVQKLTNSLGEKLDWEFVITGIEKNIAWFNNHGCSLQKFFVSNSVGGDPRQIPAVCAGNTGENELVQELFSNYNSDMPPTRRISDSSSNTVLIGVSLEQILNVNVEENSINVRGVLFKSWTDSRLSWRPLDHNYIKSVRVQNKGLWIPDISQYELSGTQFTEKVEGIGTAKIRSEGFVSISSPGDFRLRCKMMAMNLTKYPYEELTCNFLHYSPSGDSGIQIQLLNGGIGLVDYLPNQEWELMSFAANKTLTGNGVLFTMTIRRRGESKVTMAQWITALISILAILSALLPPSTIFKTVMAGIATVCSIWATWFFNPTTSDVLLFFQDDPPGIVMFFGKFAILSFGLFVWSTILYWMTHIHGGPSPPCLNKGVLRMCCWLTPPSKPQKSHTGGAQSSPDSSGRSSAADSVTKSLVQDDNNEAQHQTPSFGTRPWKICAFLIDRAFFLLITIGVVTFALLEFPRK